ncbi:MAG: hypothetical protein IT209_00710 [Armatimonadetes bacterium]|nr:hypothetical protein [Armatimonadota bacterium]
MKTRMALGKLLTMLPQDIQSGVQARLGDEEHPELLRKARASQLSIEDGERAAIQVISTRDVDRDDDIMDPKGCVLDEYRLNPVVLWNHDYSQPPVAKCVDIRADAEKITVKSVYAQTPFAEEVYQLKREGILQAASVGFVPLEVVYKGSDGWADTVNELKERWGVNARYFSDAWRVIKRWMLLEYSDVPIPANQNALQVAVGKSIDEKLLRQLKANATEVEAEETPPHTDEAPAQPVRSLDDIKVSPVRIVPAGRFVSVRERPVEADVLEAIYRRQGRL